MHTLIFDHFANSVNQVLDIVGEQQFNGLNARCVYAILVSFYYTPAVFDQKRLNNNKVKVHESKLGWLQKIGESERVIVLGSQLYLKLKATKATPLYLHRLYFNRVDQDQRFQ